MTEPVVRLREIEPLSEINGDTGKLLATVDTVRSAWDEHSRLVSPEEFGAARLRTLRRHAIETGIIERVYDLSWGVTEALVAEGITRQAAAREGGISEDTLAIVNSQLDALEMLTDSVRAGRPLTLSHIKELHAAVTGNQASHDGSRPEYALPAQVQSQLERLLALHEQTVHAHPIVRSAWLHHRFVAIHPFPDGNGRVAMALTLTVLLQARYAPLVVDRSQRPDYIDALEAADEGDLRPLVRLFAGLELAALESELSAPVSQATRATGVLPVARELVGRLQQRRRSENEQRAESAVRLAVEVQRMVVAELTRLAGDLEPEFRAVDQQARIDVDHASPGEERAGHWRGQIVHAARCVGFFVDLRDGSWWVSMHVNALNQVLRYLVIVQKVGHGDRGVLAVTTCAEVLDKDQEPGSAGFGRALEPPSKDSVTLVHTNSAGDRWTEIAELIDRTLSTALKYFVDQLS